MSGACETCGATLGQVCRCQPEWLRTEREIVRTILASGNGGRVDELLAERARKSAAGNVVDASEVSRTIDDLVGHWHDGEYVGADRIERALVLARKYAGKLTVRGTGEA